MSIFNGGDLSTDDEVEVGRAGHAKQLLGWFTPCEGMHCENGGL